MARPPTIMEDAVITEGIAKSFGPIQAIRDITLRVSPGLTYGLLGPSWIRAFAAS